MSWMVHLLKCIAITQIIICCAGIFCQSPNGDKDNFHQGLRDYQSNFTLLSSMEWANGSSSNPFMSMVGTVGYSVTTGDVDSDGSPEIITTSLDYNETSWFQYHFQASVRVWKFSEQLELIGERVWYGDPEEGATPNVIKTFSWENTTYILTGGSLDFKDSPSMADIRIWKYFSGHIILVNNVSWRDFQDKDSSVNYLQVCDVNDDGFLEIIVAGSIKWTENGTKHRMASLSVWKIQEDLSLNLIDKKIWWDNSTNNTGTLYVDIDDLNNDGIKEIVVGGFTGYVDSGQNKTKAQITVWHLLASGLVKIKDVSWIDVNSCTISTITLYDINSDGYKEIIAGGTNKNVVIAGEISVWNYELSQICRMQFYIDPQSTTHRDCWVWDLACEDFDSDGSPEIVVCGTSSGPSGGTSSTYWGFLSSFTFAGNNLSMEAKYYWLDREETEISQMCFQDLNGDSHFEIITIGTTSDVESGIQHVYAKLWIWEYKNVPVSEISWIFLDFIALLPVVYTIYFYPKIFD